MSKLRLYLHNMKIFSFLFICTFHIGINLVFNLEILFVMAFTFYVRSSELLSLTKPDCASVVQINSRPFEKLYFVGCTFVF